MNLFNQKLPIKLVYFLIAGLMGATFLSIAYAESRSTTENMSPGEKIYRLGIGHDGEKIKATVQEDVQLFGKSTACVKCHRLSGYGSSEGNVNVPTITGRILFEKREIARSELHGKRSSGSTTRSAYTQQSLKKVMNKGINPDGRTLDFMMPRYDLSDDDISHLTQYLKQLSANLAPGVDEKTIHFATIISDQVPEENKETIAEIIKSFQLTKNANTRNEFKRAQFSPWHKEWHYQSYRKWKTHIWELKGKPDTWADQLKTFYKKQPVFSIIGGQVLERWAPIHIFCEIQKIPCLFPSTALPMLRDSDFYTIYFSKGITLEAQVLAQYLLQKAEAKKKNIIQLFEDDDYGRTASQAFLKHRVEMNKRTASFVIADHETNFLPDLATEKLLKNPFADLIIWTDDQPLLEKIASKINETQFEGSVFLPSAINRDTFKLSELIKNPIFFVHPKLLKSKLKRRLLRTRAWIKSRKIKEKDIESQANSYFSAMITAGALKHVGNTFSREYFIERIEHMIDNALITSVYPSVTLAPGQRYVSSGAYIIDARKNGKAISEWIIAN